MSLKVTKVYRRQAGICQLYTQRRVSLHHYRLWYCIGCILPGRNSKAFGCLQHLGLRHSRRLQAFWQGYGNPLLGGSQSAEQPHQYQSDSHSWHHRHFKRRYRNALGSQQWRDCTLLYSRRQAAGCCQGCQWHSIASRVRIYCYRQNGQSDHQDCSKVKNILLRNTNPEDVPCRNVFGISVVNCPYELIF